MKFINWLKSLFSPKKEVHIPKPNPEVPTKEEVENFPSKPKLKIAIIVGHGNGDSGAVAFNGTTEFKYNDAVAQNILFSNTVHEVKLFYRSDSGITGVAKRAVAWGPDICIEMHLNAFNGKAKGCEVLVLKGDNESAKLARDFANKFTSRFNRVLRGDKGVKWLSPSERGATSLKALSPIPYAILIESFFIDNKEEWIDPLIYSEFLVQWINGL